MTPSEPSNATTPISFQAADLRPLVKGIRRIVRANDLQSRALARRTGLTSPQLVILTGVAELGEVTTNALSEYADLSPATVVLVLENLEQRGIVERYRSTTDRRIVFTRLTPLGATMMAASTGPLGPAFGKAFAALSEKRRAEIVSAVGELADLLASTAPDTASK